MPREGCVVRHSKNAPAKVEMGQSLQKRDVHPTSALPPKATELRTSGHVRKVPTAEVTALFNQPVGTGEKRRWQFKAKRLCRLQVNHQFEANLLNIRHVARIGTFQNLRDLHSHRANRRFHIKAIGHQPSGLHIIRYFMYRGKADLSDQLNQQKPMGKVLELGRKNNSIDLISLNGIKYAPVLRFGCGAAQSRIH